MRRRSALAVGAALLLVALTRLPLLTRTGLWVDEVFSLAIATGHSLEHPAAEAAAGLGDFAQGDRPLPAEDWRAFLRHETPPAGPERVVRAVLLSDTSPPLYYLLLWGWTRVVGTSDAALRSLSLACALACVPFLGRLARWAGGRGAVVPACLLFALSPLSIYYGTEGRMYTLLWLCVLAFAWLTVELRARGSSPAHGLAWIAAGACGFLTHYFFGFVWGALLLLGLLRPGRVRRGSLLVGASLTLAAVLPWYVRLGESLGRWRITQGWLEWEPYGFVRASAALDLLLGFFSGSEPALWGVHEKARAAALGLFALLALLLAWKLRARALGSRRLLLWLWLAAAWAGPLVFDGLRGTHTVAVPRYALAGLPAALLLAGVALGTLRPWLRAGFLAALCAAWGPHLELLYRKDSRSWCPLREVARSLEANTDPRDLVLVHSIPSGMLGIARYYEGGAVLAPWVGQLGERAVPESLLALAGGRRQIHLVVVHEVGAPAPEEDWLRANAVVTWEGKRESARVVHFRPRAGASF